jgi:hypothetical protein
MKDLNTLVLRAQQGDKVAMEDILLIYKPLIIKHSWVNNRFDEDLHQFIIPLC